MILVPPVGGQTINITDIAANRPVSAGGIRGALGGWWKIASASFDL